MFNQNDKNIEEEKIKGHIDQSKPYFIEFKPFIKDRYMSFIYTKGQKILSAIYLITDTLKNEEPIKWETRKLAVQMLSNIHIFIHLKERDVNDFDNIRNTINHLLSILSVLSNSGSVSSGNIKIISQEIEKIISHIESLINVKDPNLEEYPELTDKIKNLLSGSIEKPLAIEKNSNFIKDIYKGHLDVKGHNQYLKKTSASIFIKTARKNSILNIIKDKKVITLKDIEVAFPDVSNKTVQREIMSLIKEGLIKQEGKKRWTKYVIAN